MIFLKLPFKMKSQVQLATFTREEASSEYKQFTSEVYMIISAWRFAKFGIHM
jgi:hypothetical protein